MLSFKELQEKKTKVIINPKKDQVMEGSCGDKDMKKNHGEDCDCQKCDKKRRKEELGDETEISTEETAYVSQEEVTEESNKESDSETKLLTFNQYNEESINEATRLKKEKGYDKGGTRKPTGGKQKDSALDFVKAQITAKYGKGAIMSGGSKQQKKVKGAKSDAGTGKYKKMSDNRKAADAKAKKAGFKDRQSYADTMARYGGEDNYRKGRGLGS